MLETALKYVGGTGEIPPDTVKAAPVIALAPEMMPAGWGAGGTPGAFGFVQAESVSQAAHGRWMGDAPFAAFEAEISSKTTYDAPQQLGLEMRQDGIQCCLYVSARALGRMQTTTRTP